MLKGLGRVCLVFFVVFISVSLKYCVRNTDWNSYATIRCDSLPAGVPNVITNFKKHFPEEYQEICTPFSGKFADRKNVAQLAGKVGESIQKKLSKSSSETILSFVRLFMKGIDIGLDPSLEPRSSDPLLYPDEVMSPFCRNGLKIENLPRSVKEDMLSIWNDIIVTYDERITIPTASDVKGEVAFVFKNMYSIYGEDIQYFQNPSYPLFDVTGEKRCRMVRDLYKEIMKLPKNQSVKILRLMFS